MGVKVIVKSAKMRIEGRDAHPDEFSLSDRRMDICKKCEHYIDLTGQCSVCNCFMKLKTLVTTATCPKGKWVE